LIKLADTQENRGFARGMTVKILAKWWDLPPTVGQFLR
jgi:hypothetical protein